NSDSILKAVSQNRNTNMNNQQDASLTEAAAYRADEHLIDPLVFRDPPSFVRSCETKCKENKQQRFADEGIDLYQKFPSQVKFNLHQDTSMEEKPPIISPYGETFICDNAKDAKLPVLDFCHFSPFSYSAVLQY
ncbi:hypothetical protein EK904_001331, partial [Melospiza melodia maxima]